MGFVDLVEVGCAVECKAAIHEEVPGMLGGLEGGEVGGDGVGEEVVDIPIEDRD